MSIDAAALGGAVAGRFATRWNGWAGITANFSECPTRVGGATHTCAGAETVIDDVTRPLGGPASPETL